MKKMFISSHDTAAFATASLICDSVNSGYRINCKENPFFLTQMARLKQIDSCRYHKLIKAVTYFSEIKGYNIVTDAEGNILSKKEICRRYAVVHLNKSAVEALRNELRSDRNQSAIRANIERLSRMYI